MKDVRKKRFLISMFIMVSVLAMTGTGCRSGEDKEGKEEAPESCLAGEAYRLSMEAVSALGELSEGLLPLMEETASFIWNLKDKFLDTYLYGMDNGETKHYFIQSGIPDVYFSEVKENSIPGELAEYLVEALREEKLEESLQKIEAEYELLGEEEKQAFYFDLPDNRRGDGIALYYLAIKDDNWYRVSLTEEGNDIVVEHVGNRDVCIVNYFFWNADGRDTYMREAMRAGGQPGSRPYFIEWDDKNYLAIPYWDREGETVIGVTVYKYWHCDYAEVLAVGKNSDSSICVIPQIIDRGEKFQDFPFNATKWPIVVRY